MATSKKAAVKKAAPIEKAVSVKRSAVKKSVVEKAPVQLGTGAGPERVLRKEDLVTECIDLVSKLPAAAEFAGKLFAKPGEEQITAVLNHGFIHYTAMVMDAQNILQEKLDKKDSAGLLEIVKAQFTIK